MINEDLPSVTASVVGITNDPASAVACENIRKQFGQELILDDVSFSLRKGSFVSIVGPSGCGKTTILRTIANLEQADSGTIRLGDGKGSTPSLAVVFQQGSLFPWKSVRRNVAFGLEVAGADRATIRERVEQTLEMVHLKGTEKKFPYQLSGGMQQRVGIARALALDPDILLMDEPFASVDAQTREELHDELLEIWERTRKTVLFVTHSIDEAIVLSDEIIVMGSHPGRILERFAVELPRPRTEESARISPAFAELHHEIRKLLISSAVESHHA